MFLVIHWSSSLDSCRQDFFIYGQRCPFSLPCYLSVYRGLFSYVYQILDLSYALIGHTGSLSDQFFIIFDLCLSAVTADQQPVTCSPLIRLLDIITLFPVDLLSLI